MARIILWTGTGERLITTVAETAWRATPRPAAGGRRIVPARPSVAASVLMPRWPGVGAARIEEEIALLCGRAAAPAGPSALPGSAATGGSGAEALVLAAALWALPRPRLATILRPLGRGAGVALEIALAPRLALWSRLRARAAVALDVDIAAPPPWGTADHVDAEIACHAAYYAERVETWTSLLPEATLTLHDEADPTATARALTALGLDRYPADRPVAGPGITPFPGTAAARAPAAGAGIGPPVGWKALAMAGEIAISAPADRRRRRLWATGLAHGARALGEQGIEGWCGAAPVTMAEDAQATLALHYRWDARCLAAAHPGAPQDPAGPLPRERRGMADIAPGEIRAVQTRLNRYLATHDRPAA
ncbi:MAG: hypothetical protein AAFV86_14975 [Pseudomonadota bacterium]